MDFLHYFWVKRVNRFGNVHARSMFHMIIIKLSSTNFLPLGNQILSLLISQNLVGYIDGSLPEPPEHILSKSTSIPNPKHAI